MIDDVFEFGVEDEEKECGDECECEKVHGVGFECEELFFLCLKFFLVVYNSNI